MTASKYLSINEPPSGVSEATDAMSLSVESNTGTSATSSANNHRPPTPRRLVGRQAGFTLAFLIGTTIVSAILILGVLAFSGNDDGTDVMAWVQLLTDPLPVAIIFTVAMSLRADDNTVTPEGTALHLHWHSRTNMTASALTVFVLVIFAIGGFSSVVDAAVQAIADAMHWKPTTSLSQLDSITYSIPGILAICIVGPICEEVLFRGVIMENLRQYGPIFAIITSSFLFGAMHGDLAQSTSAFLAGLLFGYIAYCYSLTWSIALHIFNNTLSSMVTLIPSHSFSDCLNILSAVATVVLLILMIVKRSIIKATIKSHRPPEHIWRSWRSPLFIVTLVYCVLTMLSRFNI